MNQTFFIYEMLDDIDDTHRMSKETLLWMVAKSCTSWCAKSPNNPLVYSVS